MSVLSKISALTSQLYPTGRAFKMPIDGVFEKLHFGLRVSEAVAYEDALEILFGILPDNDRFTNADATYWEDKLGVIQAPTLEERKVAIARKMNHPGTIKTRQHYLYLEKELQGLGFDVYVYENRFDDGAGGLETRDPITVSGGIAGGSIQHGNGQHADFQHGGTFTSLVANSISNDEDVIFNVGSNLRSTFFIGGEVVGDYANVPKTREKEFRELILKIKPVQTVAYLFINYI